MHKRHLFKILLATMSFTQFSCAFGVSGFEGLIEPSHCSIPEEKREYLKNDDFNWSIGLEELTSHTNMIYELDKRLVRRARINQEKNVVMPIKVPSRGYQDVQLTPRFVKSVKMHIEKALERNYVDAITFSDMGHAHILIPQKVYKEEISPIPIRDKNLLYQKMLAHREVKFLYHTAELIDLKSSYNDPLLQRHLRWRFYTRNLLGGNQALGKLDILHNHEHPANSVNRLEGYKYWGAGFDISANKNGCFVYTYNGKKYFYDINFEGIHVY